MFWGRKGRGSLWGADNLSCTEEKTEGRVLEGGEECIDRVSILLRPAAAASEAWVENVEIGIAAVS